MKTHAPNLSECHGRSRETRSTLAVSAPEGFCISASGCPTKRGSECVATPVAPSSYVKSCDNAGHSGFLRYASCGSPPIRGYFLGSSLIRDRLYHDVCSWPPCQLPVFNHIGTGIVYLPASGCSRIDADRNLFKCFIPSTLRDTNSMRSSL